MRLANAVRKYAYTVINSLERTPDAWGDEHAVEKLYIHSLELLALSLGKDMCFITERRKALLDGNLVSLAAAGKSNDEILQVLSQIRRELEQM